MDEISVPVTEALKKEEAGDNQEKLPTTPEIAAEGVKVFEEVFNDLPKDLRELFLEEPAFRATFVGIRPESKIPSYITNQLSREQVAVLRRIVDATPQMRLFHTYSPKTGQLQQQRFSLLNLSSAQHVIESYSNYFPEEATQDPTWLLDHLSEWNDDKGGKRQEVSTRYGLLSGFPEKSVALFRQYQEINEGLNLDSLSDEENKFLLSYKAGKYDSESLEGLKVGAILRKANPNITDSEITLFKNARSIYCKSLNGYLGFDKASDAQYTKSCDKIYTGSGIEDLAKRLADNHPSALEL